MPRSARRPPRRDAAGLVDLAPEPPLPPIPKLLSLERDDAAAISSAGIDASDPARALLEAANAAAEAVRASAEAERRRERRVFAARDRATLRLTVRAVREGLRALRALGYPPTPFNVAAISWMPVFASTAIFSRILASDFARVAFAGHAASATAEFELLYGELEQWRVRETAKVEAEFPPETDARRLAMSQLLAKETELIRTIGRLRIAANNANRERRVERALEDMSQTKRWERKDGSLVEVDTPFTVRARELARLYDALRLETRRDVSTDERLDVLVHVKWTVKEFDCGLTREIVELADREADLLNRGRDPAAMTGLRRRIANLFLQFVETPEFNPESARYSVTNVVNGTETDDGLTLQEAAMLSATRKFSRPIRNR